jgi:hypothetical protein
VQGPRKIISASGAVVQEYIAGDSFWIQKLLVAITAWSFHTVCMFLECARRGVAAWCPFTGPIRLVLQNLLAFRQPDAGKPL